jgi:hypothetical protein
MGIALSRVGVGPVRSVSAPGVEDCLGQVGGILREKGARRKGFVGKGSEAFSERVLGFRLYCRENEVWKVGLGDARERPTGNGSQKVDKDRSLNAKNWTLFGGKSVRSRIVREFRRMVEG